MGNSRSSFDSQSRRMKEWVHRSESQRDWEVEKLFWKKGNKSSAWDEGLKGPVWIVKKYWHEHRLWREEKQGRWISAVIMILTQISNLIFMWMTYLLSKTSLPLNLPPRTKNTPRPFQFFDSFLKMEKVSFLQMVAHLRSPKDQKQTSLLELWTTLLLQLVLKLKWTIN